MSEPITASSMSELLEGGERLLLDTRPMAAFNGWRLHGEARGGHLPGAVPFPASWLDAADTEPVTNLLRDKGAVADRSLAVCGADSASGRDAAASLERLGFRDVRFLEGGVRGWAEEPTRALERLPRHERLVHPDWLARCCARRDAGELERRFVLAHVSFDNRGDYERGHIADAIYLDTLALEEPERWNRRAPEELERALVAHGIDEDTLVVVYGRTGTPDMSQAHPGKEAGQLAAMRAAMLLMYAGVRDVRVLDGGLNAWIAAGYGVTTEEVRPEPVTDFGSGIPGRPELMIDIDQARRLLAGDDSELVSVRSWAEFIGEVSGYHYVKPKGRIPGAVFGNCGSDAYHMQNYRNHDNTLRDYHEIAASWRAAGITPDKQLGFYCGTGWRASEACFCAFLMGWDRAAVYDGGWFDWSIDTENPLETGVPASPPPRPSRMT